MAARVGQRTRLRAAGVAILLALSLTFAPDATLGQSDDYNFCYDNCTTVCPYGPASDWSCRMSCATKCTNESLKKPLPPAPYGAIAFGDQGAEGMSWNQTSSEDADRVALGICNRYGTNCKLVYRFENTCGALAKSADEGHFEAATAPTKEEAAADAVAACKSRWGTCASDLSSCSYANRSQPPPPPRAISWGAIAFSPSDGQAGWSQGKDDQASAEKEALGNCSRRGKSCAVMTAFDKQCGGLARDGTVAGTAVAADQQQAMQQAVQACARNGGARCVIQVLFCSR